MSENRRVACDTVIPEGRRVYPIAKGGSSP